jgi:hypothetical protein
VFHPVVAVVPLLELLVVPPVVPLRRPRRKKRRKRRKSLMTTWVSGFSIKRSLLLKASHWFPILSVQ